jgi:hypothetical protein
LGEVEMGVITKAYIGIASVCIRYGDCSTHRRPSMLVDRRRKRFQGNSLIHTREDMNVVDFFLLD